MAPNDHEISAADHRRLARWRNHMNARGTSSPDVEDFLAFGSLSTLERLRPALVIHSPRDCGQLRLAIQHQRRRKSRPETCVENASRRGPARHLSVTRNELPAEWIKILDRMQPARDHIDRGGLHLSGPKPPSASSIRHITYVLRALARSCQVHGLVVEFGKEALTAWIDDAEARGCAASGLALQIGMLQRFSVRLLGKKADLTAKLAELRKTYAMRSKRVQKIKERFLLTHPQTLGQLWLKAEDLREQAHELPPGSAARHQLLREALALALTIVVPLRIGDLHRLRIETHLRRTATGWSLRARTCKTGDDYEREHLWDEVTPFLDDLVVEDAIGSDLWLGYDSRADTPIFSPDGGRTGLTADWLSDVWETHVGSGAHIIRTLWHQLCWESDRDATWIALALCGQRDERTAASYRIEGARRRAARQGRALMRSHRATGEDQEFATVELR